MLIKSTDFHVDLMGFNGFKGDLAGFHGDLMIIQWDFMRFHGIYMRGSFAGDFLMGISIT
jgi:hypothetical protein